MTYKITIKEVGKEKPIVTYYSGKTSFRELKAFYGLEEPDVEWFTIENETIHGD